MSLGSALEDSRQRGESGLRRTGCLHPVSSRQKVEMQPAAEPARLVRYRECRGCRLTLDRCAPQHSNPESDGLWLQVLLREAREFNCSN